MPSYATCYGCRWCVVGLPDEIRSLSVNDGIFCTWERDHKDGDARPITQVEPCPREANR